MPGMLSFPELPEEPVPEVQLASSAVRVVRMSRAIVFIFIGG
jgi:hypothetical protein